MTPDAGCGLDWVLALQSVRQPWLDGVMLGASALGSETAYVIAIPLLYWCVHRRVGVGVLLFLCASSVLNDSAKWLAGLPRPYWVDSRVLPGWSARSFGAPSGHAQNGLGVWGWMALSIQRRFGVRWPFGVVAALASLVAASRVYLGVHFPRDLVWGWALAVSLLLAFGLARRRVVARTGAGENPSATLKGSLLLAGALGLVAAAAHHWAAALDPGWQARATHAHRALGDLRGLAPHDASRVAQCLALVVSVGVGLPLERRFARFDSGGPWRLRLARYALGVALLFGLHFGGGWLRSLAEPAWRLPITALRSFAMGAWVLAFAPGLFLHLGLAQPDAGGPAADPPRRG